MSEDLEALLSSMRKKRGVLVLYSGGVDSALLAWAAFRALPNRSLALLVDSESFPRYEREGALKFASTLGIPLEVVARRDLEDPRYVRNLPDRCYFCREGIAKEAWARATQLGFESVAVGTHLSDLGEWRPGIQALREWGVWEPYVELGWDKERVRRAAREAGLAVAHKPSMACLSSRIPYGTPITEPELRRIERAEKGIFDLGFTLVRVRSRGTQARVEVLLEEMERARALWPTIEGILRSAGYTEGTLDPRGYRAGSLALEAGLQGRTPRA